MPLVRFELKNEYGLGDPRLYLGAPMEEEDPRNILGGVAVSGLVGILRQLGDLAESVILFLRQLCRILSLLVCSHLTCPRFVFFLWK